MFLDVSCTIGGMTSTEWKRVATLVIARRTELGMRTRESFADTTGLSARMLGDLEKARRSNFDPGALARIEIALRWAPGSVDDILNGGLPRPLAEKGTPAKQPGSAQHLSGVVVDELKEATESLRTVSSDLRGGDQGVRRAADTVTDVTETLLSITSRLVAYDISTVDPQGGLALQRLRESLVILDQLRSSLEEIERLKTEKRNMESEIEKIKGEIDRSRGLVAAAESPDNAESRLTAELDSAAGVGIETQVHDPDNGGQQAGRP